MSNVRISQLNGFSNILGEDFIPLIDSSSLTTYRTTITTLVGFFASSGSVLSASWASQSISSSFAVDSISSSYSSTASFLNYPNISTASVAISSSYATSTLSASYAKSSSAANSASFATSALSSSYAQTSSVANTASYFNFSIGVPPFASSSLSSSWASASLSSLYSSASLSSSYSLTSSYAESVFSAKVLCTISASGTGYVWAGYNVRDVRYNWTGSLTAGGNSSGRFLVTFREPLKMGYIAIANGSQRQYAEITNGSRYIDETTLGGTICAAVNSQSVYVETWTTPTLESDINNINLVVYGEWSGSGAGYPPIVYTAATRF